MNIFMPETSIRKSIVALDDKRLIKQILECYQIVNINDRILKGEQKVGYANHPVVKFYRDKRDFVIEYGYEACVEYWYRFNKNHAYYTFFAYEYLAKTSLLKQCKYEVIYVAKRNTNENTIVNNIVDGKITDSLIITLRQTNYKQSENVCEAFRKKLIDKWNNDKRQPKWTNRDRPKWYKDSLGCNDCLYEYLNQCNQNEKCHYIKKLEVGFMPVILEANQKEYK